MAAASGHYDMVQVNAMKDFFPKLTYQLKALMLKVLIGQGADLTTPDKEGWTALHCAASAGFLDVVKLLVESGASPDVSN